jgi:putative transposase
VWCADITYIAVRRGFLYLVAIMDWATRHVQAWRLSNTMDARFCIEALDEALAEYGRPEIFNTDQGSQGEFKRSSQHPDEGGCDEHSKAAFGSVWAGAIVVTRSTAGGRTRRAATVLGSYRGRHGE